MPKTLVIGDIHGCYAELQALLDRAGLAEGDRLVGAGDMVDRGPETPQVAAFFQNTPGARAVMGNHERKHVRGARHEVKLALSQQISILQFGPAYPDALAWMAGLPLYLELEDALVLHGYLEPGVPLERQNPSVLCGTMGGDKILRERYAQPWYELCDAGKPVIVGHHNYTGTDRPFVYQDRVFGLDTDCVTGRALTGLLLPDFRLISVPSRGNLWLQVSRANQALKPAPAAPKAHPVWNAEQKRQFQILGEMLQEINARLLARLGQVPGYADLTPRQQAKSFAELAGRGPLANLLHLARQGLLNQERLQRLAPDPQQLGQLLEKVQACAASPDELPPD